MKDPPATITLFPYTTLFRSAHNAAPAGSLVQIQPPQPIFPAAMLYRVYVIQNREGKFYIGLTDDVGRRINQHNMGGSRWTRGKGPWTLVWQSAEMNLSSEIGRASCRERVKVGGGC